jgi:hypothetical protein
LQQVADEEKSHVRQILQIFCISARPIRLTEVAEVYQIGDNIQPPFMGESVLFHPEDVVDICQGLLMAVKDDKLRLRYLYHDSPPKDEQIMIVQLAHFSVKEYLLSSRSASWMLTEEASHISIIRTSIASFLHAASIDAPVGSRDRKIDTLAAYFGQHLSQHLNMLHPREHPALVPSFEVLDS